MVMMVGGRADLVRFCCLFEELVAFSNVRRAVFGGGFLNWTQAVVATRLGMD